MQTMLAYICVIQMYLFVPQMYRSGSHLITLAYLPNKYHFTYWGLTTSI